MSSSNSDSFRQIVGRSPSTASVADSTLIIVDAQNEYASGKLRVNRVVESRQVISDLLARYRSGGNGRNIIHVVHEVPHGAPVFTPGTELAAEFDELKPKNDEKVITKRFPNSFFQTDLHEYLQSLGNMGKKIVLVGYMAHVCISTTARAGDELGYDVLVVADGISDRNIPGTEADELVSVVRNELGDAFATIVHGSEIK